MQIHPEETVRAAQAAFMDLLEQAELAAAHGGPNEVQELREDAQKTVLRLIAAVMLADGSYDPGEREFIRLLVNWKDKPGGEMRYLNEYASEWAVKAREVPRFFKAAARRDANDGSDIAKTMLRRIQLIGNYASISDGKFEPSERQTVRDYVAFLENYIESPHGERLKFSEEQSRGGLEKSLTLEPEGVRAPAQSGGAEDAAAEGWANV